MRRRSFIAAGLPALGADLVANEAMADVPRPYDWHAVPPMDSRDAFISWMVEYRGEDPKYLGERFDRFQEMTTHHDLWGPRSMRAFLLTPRERFVTAANLDRAYQVHYLDIGYGVTITGPNTVGRMTNTIEPRAGERVLEVGTGSGYQSACLANLTSDVFTIEIIKPLFERTGRLYETLIGQGYSEYRAVNRKNEDGYYGWPEHAPFDKIIVTCGIDHIPPPLLQQLKPDGVMVIPVGPPGAQHVLKVVKQRRPDGTFRVARSDIYGGSIVNFVPFTKLVDGRIEGTHSG